MKTHDLPISIQLTFCALALAVFNVISWWWVLLPAALEIFFWVWGLIERRKIVSALAADKEKESA